MFAGDTAFKLYDTYGFPLDLTQDALKPRGITVDTAGFDAAMEKQKEEARKAWKGSGEAATETVWFEVRRGPAPPTSWATTPKTAEGEIRAILKDGKEAGSLKAGDEAALVLNQTPFYGESGGQVGDQGVIKGAKGALFRVTDTQKKLGDLFVHIGRVEKGASSRATPSNWSSITRAARPRAPTIRPPTSCTRRCGRCWAHVAQKGSRGWCRTSCCCCQGCNGEAASRMLDRLRGIVADSTGAHFPGYARDDFRGRRDAARQRYCRHVFRARRQRALLRRHKGATVLQPVDQSIFSRRDRSRRRVECSRTGHEIQSRQNHPRICSRNCSRRLARTRCAPGRNAAPGHRPLHGQCGGLFRRPCPRLRRRIPMPDRADRDVCEALLAERLAPIAAAPPKIIRTLALDEVIEVSGPVLTNPNGWTRRP